MTGLFGEKIIRVGRCAIVLAVLLRAATAAAAEPPVFTGKGHPFACADYTQGKLFLVGPDGKVQWEHPAPTATTCGACPTATCSSYRPRRARDHPRNRKGVFTTNQE